LLDYANLEKNFSVYMIFS